MSAYFVVELEITNSAAMEPYRSAVGATIEQYGGRFLARAGATELIEGGPEPSASSFLNSLTKRRSSAGTIPRIPENPDRTPRQFDQPRLRCRGRELGRSLVNKTSAKFR